MNVEEARMVDQKQAELERMAKEIEAIQKDVANVIRESTISQSIPKAIAEYLNDAWNEIFRASCTIKEELGKEKEK